MKKLILTFLLLLAFTAGAFADTKADVMKVSRETVLAIKAKNMTKLATLVHPTKGVRFSAYGYIDTEQDVVIKKPLISGLWASKKRYLWGAFDGTGDPIRMRFPKYYARFIYDRDFSRAPNIKYHEQIGHGNTIVNVLEAYPKAKFVEYHFPEDTDRNDMGWASLRLIFERSGKKWYLVGISHDEWTI